MSWKAAGLPATLPASGKPKWMRYLNTMQGVPLCDAFAGTATEEGSHSGVDLRYIQELLGHSCTETT
jgi:hypothetical protein